MNNLKPCNLIVLWILLTASSGFAQARLNSFALNHKQAGAFYNNGVLAEKSGDLETAVSNYRSAIQLAPTVSGAYYNLGVIFYEQRKCALSRLYLSLFSQLDARTKKTVQRSKSELKLELENISLALSEMVNCPGEPKLAQTESLYGIAVVPESFSITQIDSSILTQGSLKRSVRIGRHLFRGTSPQGVWELTHRIHFGETHQLPASNFLLANTPKPEDEDEDEDKSSPVVLVQKSNTPFYVASSLTAVSLVLATVFNWNAVQTNDAMGGELESSARYGRLRERRISQERSTVFFLSTALISAGVVYFEWD